jgi:hypothetical protein
LKCKRLQIPHQVDVFAKRFRDSEWNFRIGRGILRLLHVVQTAFDFADIVEVFRQASTIGSRQTLVQSRDFLRDRIKKAAFRLLPGHPFAGIAAVTEKTLENDLRIGLMRERLGRARP